MSEVAEARRRIAQLYEDAHAKAQASDTRTDRRAWVHRGREEAFAQALAILSTPDLDPFAGLEGVTSEPVGPFVVTQPDGTSVTLPRQFTHVEALVGYGYPELAYRLRKARNFTRPADARRWVDALAWPPGHHQLLTIYESRPVTWAAITAADLPTPEPIEDDPDA